MSTTYVRKLTTGAVIRDPPRPGTFRFSVEEQLRRKTCRNIAESISNRLGLSAEQHNFFLAAARVR